MHRQINLDFGPSANKERTAGLPSSWKSTLVSRVVACAVATPSRSEDDPFCRGEQFIRSKAVDGCNGPFSLQGCLGSLPILGSMHPQSQCLGVGLLFRTVLPRRYGSSELYKKCSVCCCLIQAQDSMVWCFKRMMCTLVALHGLRFPVLYMKSPVSYVYLYLCAAPPLLPLLVCALACICAGH